MGTDESPTIDPPPIVLPGLRPVRRSVPGSLAARYDDVRYVGEGGMGTVYRAVDPRLGRVVALKLLKGDDPDLWRRFLGEARSQARIQHDNICRVYEAGQADGEPYIVMQYIEGEPLSRACERLSMEQLVHLMAEVSLAVHEAHRVGLIHRDIKPGNILVEEREDGTKKPYVMDFGLARQVEDEGQTRSGAVVGTLAFMPPEQARGDVRALDRRSDVYSLGATLYDVIAGRPPFVAEHPWKLLMMVGHDDAPSLARVKKGVPQELETIVMKCLERERARRYDSARALAEDLRRFLDGEPILAKRASPGYVLRKKVRKNKLLTALLTALVLGSLLGTGAWVRARRQAAARERLAQELGESVKEMELFLRAAYALPLHDVERERDVVRARLRAIEQRMASAGEVGEGPGRYAIGRGYLALGDPAEARAHLERAIAAGYSSVDLEYALGRALGELFRRAVEETKRLANAEERRRRVAELERSLRDPALSHLRAAAGARIESPLYAEGLVALYEGKNEEAIAKAREAFQAAPWMYEAKKLEGDALFAEGSKHRHDAAFDHEKMESYFGPAARAYQVAAEMGSSDPEVYRAQCELWEKVGWADWSAGKYAAARLEQVDPSCDRAVHASSKERRTRVQRALAIGMRAVVMRNLGARGGDAAIDLAVRAAEEAVSGSPGDVMAHYARASALGEASKLRFQRGLDAPVEEVVAAYERVLELDPTFTWAVNELGQVFVQSADLDRLHGRDPRGALEKALTHLDRALALDPTFSPPMQKRVEVYAELVEHEQEHGRPADRALASLFDALAELERKNSGPRHVAYWNARGHRLRAENDLVSGRDPRPEAARGIEILHGFAGPSFEDQWLLVELGEAHLLVATYSLRAGLDPAPSLAAARAAARKLLEATAGNLRGRLLAARVEMLSLRVAIQRSEARAAEFDAALAPLEPLVSGLHTDPRPFGKVAEIRALKAAWLGQRGSRVEDEVSAGLEMAQRALSLNPHLATAMAAEGSLYLSRARAERDRAARIEAARRAKEAFESAFRENPLLRQDHDGAAAESAALVQGG